MYRHAKRPLPGDDTFDGNHAFRLKQWPQIPDRFRTARVLGACSRMTVGPVTANWFLSQTGLDATDAFELISSMDMQGALERIVLARRAIGEPAPAPAPLSPVARLRDRLGRQLAWKKAALAAILCLGISAALDSGVPIGLGPFALPTLAAFSG